MHRVIQPEHCNRRPACRGIANDLLADEREVLVPLIPSRVKYWSHMAGFGINSGEIRAFEEITGDASERKIFDVIRSTVLAGNDVLHLVTDQR